MTPVLAAGFDDVAETYDVGLAQVALTTGLYMLGLGLGSVVASPTAILYGKRPVYLGAIILFTVSSIWCALSPNYPSLVVARIVQGFAVSPVECLPSATIAEIFFLHERAYRLGMYTLLLLGGKNLIPLVSAVIVQSLGWRWVFWITAIVVGFCFFLIFFFVPETFWDRTPKPRGRSRNNSRNQSRNPSQHRGIFHLPARHHKKSIEELGKQTPLAAPATPLPASPLPASSQPASPLEHHKKSAHVGFANDPKDDRPESQSHAETGPGTPGNPISIHSSHDYFPPVSVSSYSDPEKQDRTPDGLSASSAEPGQALDSDQLSEQFSIHYTDYYRSAPPKSYRESLKPWNGRLAKKDKWLRVCIRPFILFAYPAVLWGSLVYALAVGWLIVLSESVSHIYRDRDSYSFTALQVGLVYISPFVGGVLGTAVAGKVSDLVVRFMARRNDGVYEPEFRLIMALPITISTVIGLMGFGWSAEEKNNWAVPTVLFGVISFGCSLASTTAITFVVDSYRVYAGEALVTLNFSKSKFSNASDRTPLIDKQDSGGSHVDSSKANTTTDVLHGFIFSLFFPHWLESSGSKDTFIAIGGIQLACMMSSIPMYIYGKRARMWTVRKNLMEKF